MLTDRDSSPDIPTPRSSTREQMAATDWTALPPDMLQLIAQRLGLIDLLRFRVVCKDWKSGSSTASAEIEALQNHEPWFLLYGETNSQCMLFTEAGRTYSITIPELVGATCIGSHHGWLLLFHEGEGSMFFFCPFSRAKIDLPVPGLFPRTAMFSSPPTSQDCVACIISKRNETKLEYYVIHRGATAWTMHELEVEASTNKVFGAAYHNGAFFFFLNNEKMLVFLPTENTRLRMNEINLADPTRENFVPLRFFSEAEMNNINGQLPWRLNQHLLRSVCGTAVLCHGFQVMAPYYENRTNAEELPACQGLKGVWFQPRFHQIDQNQSW